MITYPHVEDYLEVISGKKNLPGRNAPANYLWAAYAPIINLARYDNAFLDNVTDQTMNGTSLTDRQAELAVKLIIKYRRQLHALGVDIGDMNAPQYRRALRIVDRQKSAGVEQDKIYLKFPYESKTIETIREMGKNSQGSIVFDKDNKVWRLAITEYNANWTYEFAKQNNFKIDSALEDLMRKIVECEQMDYRICLRKTNTGFEVQNAHHTLIQYIEQSAGGFGIDNQMKLIDMSTVLGYELEENIQQHTQDQVDGSTYLLLANKEYDFNSSESIVNRVVAYAKLANRYPIVVFNPTPDNTVDEWFKHFNQDEILYVNNKKDLEVTKNHKLIYTHRPLRDLSKIPLLVTHVGMMIGLEKQIMTSRAEKIFYTAKKLK